jgi:UDP-N-acetylglucosamine 1-carboxyvinyltransferase
MGSFRIEGGHKLFGELHPQGAKNEALQVLCAVLLTPEEVRISNIPEIRDVLKLIELLEALGVAVERLGHGSFSFRAAAPNLEYLHTDEFRKKQLHCVAPS